MSSRGGSDVAGPRSNKLKKGKDADASTNINYRCHICCIDVPAAFSEEHNASTRHRAHARIVATASERMRALLTARPAPRGRPAGKYCGACNSEVENGHEKTAKHKQAVRDDQLLCMLASMYRGEDNQDDTDENEDEDGRYVSDAKVEVNDEDISNVEDKNKDYQKDGSQKDHSDGRPKVEDLTESASREEKVENKQKKEDDGYFVTDEIVTEIDEDYKITSGASKKLWQQGESNRERESTRDGQNAAAANFERRFESDSDESESDDDDKARNDNGNADSMKDSNISHIGKTNKIGGFNAAQPNTVTFKSENTQPLKVEDNKQPNKHTHNPVGNTEMDPSAEVKNTKNNANDIKGAVNNTSKPDNVETSKADQRTKSDENQKQASVDGNVSDPYDPQRDFFWALVKRYKIEHSWSIDYINIHPAGNKIQICVDNEKLNVPYDHFHSFKREVKGLRCMVCMVYLDKGDEDNHTASKQHMARIMLTVEDSHCFREITHWRHCILCNEILMDHFEVKHKMFLKHCDSKREATVPRKTKQSQRFPLRDLDPFNHMGPYDASKQANRSQNPKEKEKNISESQQKGSNRTPRVNLDQSHRVRSHAPGQSASRNILNPIEEDSKEAIERIRRFFSKNNDERPQRRKITIQKQEGRPSSSVEEKQNGRPQPQPHICHFRVSSKLGEAYYCIECGAVLPI